MPNLSRRDFLRTSALAGTSLLVGCTFGSDPILSKPKAAQEQLGLWLRIAPDDSITLLLPSSEMGQGTSTSLPMRLRSSMGKVSSAASPISKLYEMGLLIVIGLATQFKVPPLHRIWVYLIAYGTGRFLIEFLRGDNRGIINLIPPLSPSQHLAILFVIASGYLAIRHFRLAKG